MANTAITQLICPVCGGSYRDTQSDGSAYIHKCATLSEAEAAAVDAGVTVAQLAANLKGAALTLTPAAKALVGTARTVATASTLTATLVTIGAVNVAS